MDIQVKLNHPNIVKSRIWFKEKFVKTIHTDKQKYVKYCLVMEFEELGSLFDEMIETKQFIKTYTTEVFFVNFLLTYFKGIDEYYS